MIITMPSVRHTGSQYVRHLLRSALPEHTLRSEPDQGFVTDHTYDAHMPAFRQWLERRMRGVLMTDQEGKDRLFAALARLEGE